MFNILISTLAAAALGAGLFLGAGLSPWIAGFAGLVLFTALYLLLMRHFMNKLVALMEQSQRELQGRHIERAINTLEKGYQFASWQLYVKEQINSQIGTVHYLNRNFSEAFEFLKKGFMRHWVALCMLAICYMKRNRTKDMIAAFERAVAAGKKEPLAWAVYAFCLEKVGQRDKAISILEKGLKKTGNDVNLQLNLEDLREGERMRMKGYGDMWYQFHLDKPGALIKKQTKAVQGRRKIVRR
ncbi:MAG: hypothetical protein P1P74_07420 [Desulfuromonadales bacterium]|nr:hypothetical protein [Desulfuromonadales bacterium]MDT8422989.1 hypothetical protein [Desulfuromonadales bacterium]